MSCSCRPLGDRHLPAGTTGTVDVTVTTPVTRAHHRRRPVHLLNTTWFAPRHDKPPLRYQSAEAFDPAPARPSSSAGHQQYRPYLNDTWSWNGANWAQLTPATSLLCVTGHHRLRPSMNGGELVLFGGYNGTTTLSDTWAWTGSNWASNHRRRSPGRQLAAMAYDTATSQLLLFGGNSSGTASTTLVWSGTNWAAQSPASKPGIRWDVTMAFDRPWAASGRSCCTAATAAAAATATPGPGAAPTGPSSPRRPVRAPLGGSDGYDSATTQLLLFGGYNGAYLGDTWAWNGTTWASSPRRPPNGALHVHAYDPITSQMVLSAVWHLRLHRDTWIIGAPASPPSAPCRARRREHLAHHHRLRFTGVAATGSGVMFGSTAAGSYTVTSSTSITAAVSRPRPRHGRRHGYRQRRTSPKTGADQFAYSNMTWYEAFPTTALRCALDRRRPTTRLRARRSCSR